MKVLVTGAAGFIGYHLCRRLAETRRCQVLGVDNLNDYYDPALFGRAYEWMKARLEKSGRHAWVSMEAPLAHDLDLTRSSGWARHLGRHQIGVFASFDDTAEYFLGNNRYMIIGTPSFLSAAAKANPKQPVCLWIKTVKG